MSKNRFDSDVASALGRDTYAPLSDAGNRPPRVFFELRGAGAFLRADPPGASIVCEANAIEAASRVTLVDIARGDFIADVTVHAPPGVSMTEETIAIASALYWSWWRACDMRGETPSESVTNSGTPAGKQRSGA